MSWYRCGSLIGVALLFVALSGCGSGAVTVHGELRKGGTPMVVSDDTYVTLSFIAAGPVAGGDRSAYNAKFDQKSGTYTVELKPGSYRTKLVIAPPAPAGKFSAPGRPIDSETTYDLKTNQKLDIDVPGK